MHKRNLSFKEIAVFLLLLFTVLSFTPAIILDGGAYSMARIIVLVMLVLVSFITSAYNSLKNGFIRKVMFSIFVIGLMLLFFFPFNYHVSWTDLVILFISFWAMCVGYSCNLRKNLIAPIILFYGVITVALGLATMLYFVGSLTMTDYMYMIDTKNMVGQIVATGAVGLTMITFANKRVSLLKIILLLLAVLLVFLLRCRTALVAYLLFVFYYLWKTVSVKEAIGITLLALVFIGVFHAQILSFFEDALVGNTDINNLDSLSAGRMERNIMGMEFFFSHPIFGELKTVSDLPNIHNYLIKRLAAYGVFSIPFFWIYFLYLIKLIRQWITIDVKDINNTGALMLIIPFFASLLEPLSPFGPGLVQIAPFFFYGLFLYNYKRPVVDRLSRYA